ncbi:MAG: hypothetical protein ABI689_13240 [Thermoanaerobaculia bacterium]
MFHQSRTAHRWCLPLFAPAALIGAVLVLVAPPADAQEVIEGKAILAHPAGKAVVEAGKLLKAGKLAEVKKSSAKDVRDEWAATSAADQRTESEEAAKSAPETKVLEAEIALSGSLINYGDSAMLRTESADGNSTIVAFVALEGGKWKVTAGPKTIDTTPVVETAPAIEGAAILDHEIGKVALAYAKELSAGRLDAALQWLSGPARAKRTAEPAEEKKESDAYRRSTTPAPALFANQIRAGGKVTFVGEKAYLQTLVNETTKNADGSITSTSSSMSLGFELDNGKWRVAD